MKLSRSLVLFVLVVALLGLPGCIYAHFKTPLDTDLQQTQLGSKVGEAYYTSLLWLVAWGDAGTQAAAQQGGITTINHADSEVLSILFGLYYRNWTIVYGN
ncbi:MAG: TRL domain-containing protein [Planctomycetota bacterium]